MIISCDMDLGTFSISLAVKGPEASSAFYDKFWGQSARGQSEELLDSEEREAVDWPVSVDVSEEYSDAESGTGLASFMAVDPDGNQTLVDQHR